MRRTGRNTSASRAVSGQNPKAEREPIRAPGASKRRSPEPEQPVETAAPTIICEIPAAPPTVGPAKAIDPGLHLVATPIGNLGDVTLRALDTLRGADLILCEDTRVTGKLLARYGIRTRLAAYHDHNAAEIRPDILARLEGGERVALVSDAGTPLVSDPGYKLVRAAIAAGLPVTAAPGPSAAVTALILSGLPPDTFFFAGFLPPRSAARCRALEGWAGLDATLIFYEGVSRLGESLADMAAILGPREAAVARELTKLHEEIRRGTLPDLAEHYAINGPPRGEAVIVVGPPPRAEYAPEEIDDRLRAALRGASLRDAAEEVAAETGLPRRTLYQRALTLQDGT